MGWIAGADSPLWRWVGTILARKWNVNWSGAVSVTFPNARIWNVSRMKGNKTAAPSLMRPVRDKNVNNMRRKVETIDMAAAMQLRRK